jgi:hypothetical protein
MAGGILRTASIILPDRFVTLPENVILPEHVINYVSIA